MFGWIGLAFRVGKLEARIEALEKKQGGNAGGEAPEVPEKEREADRMLREGIDNIMGYQWPRRKGDSE